MILIEAHGNRWRERDVFLARYGVGWLHSYVLPGQSLWAVPITAKDPLTLLRTPQLGNRGRDKSALLAPAARRLADCTNNVKGSFSVIGTAAPRPHVRQHQQRQSKKDRLAAANRSLTYKMAEEEGFEPS